MNEHFEFRADISCGTHVHISLSSGAYCDSQVRSMAKAVIYWEPATRRCAPASRHDQVQSFCKSNLSREVMCSRALERYGPLRGLWYAFDYIERAARDSVVNSVCPGKYFAWNFNPCKTGGHGSIEFRRPPGVVSA
jgi:hypothetical protein